MLCDEIRRKIVAKSSRVSRTRRELVADPSQFSRHHFGTRRISEINKTELRTNRDQMRLRQSHERLTTIVRVS